MLIYVLILIYIISLALKYDFRNVEFGASIAAKKQFTIAAVILTAFASLSNRVGMDVNVYYDVFKSYPTLDSFHFTDLTDFRYEPLWVLLNVISKSVFGNFYIIYAFIISLINIFIFKFIRKYSLLPFFTILCYYSITFLNLNFEMLRQSAAMVFIYLGLNYLFTGNRIKYILFAFPCIFLHKSAFIIYFLIYLTSYIKIRNWQVYACIGLFFASSFLKVIFPQMFDLLNLGLLDSGAALSHYMDKMTYEDDQLAGLKIIVVLVSRILIPSILLLNRGQYQKQPLFDKLLIVYLFISAISPVLEVSYRMVAYLQVFFFICLSNYLYPLIKKHNFDIFRCGSLVVMLYLFIRYYIAFSVPEPYFERNDMSGDMRYVPYVTIFEDCPDKTRENVFYSPDGIFKK